MKGLLVCAAITCALFAVSGEAWGDPIVFTVEPGGTATNDDAWRTSALAITPGSSHYEENFESYAHGQQVNSLSMGGVTVGISTSGVQGAEVFQSGFFASLPAGTINNKALLNWTASRTAGGPVTFTFSGDPVQAFGIWIYDDGWSAADKSTLTAVTADGTTSTSTFLDANPGGTQMLVEGFLGVRTTGRLTSVTVTNTTTWHTGLMSFEMDHLQIVSGSGVVPEPTTLALVGLGAVGLAAVRRRRRVS